MFYPTLVDELKASAFDFDLQVQIGVNWRRESKTRTIDRAHFGFQSGKLMDSSKITRATVAEGRRICRTLCERSRGIRLGRSVPLHVITRQRSYSN